MRRHRDDRSIASVMIQALALGVTAAPRAPLTRPTLPCVGLVASSTRELLVVGTAHTPCRSAAEVRTTPFPKCPPRNASSHPQSPAHLRLGR